MKRISSEVKPKPQPKRQPLRPTPRPAARSRRQRIARGYTRSDPADTAVQAAWTATTPQTRVSSGGGTVRVTRTELFAMVISDNEGNYGSYWSINPANEIVFPWLSAMAPLFEQYEFKRLSVSYMPSCNYVATGQLALAFQYDVRDEPSVEFPNVSMYQGAITGIIRSPFSIPLNKGRSALQRFYLLENGTYSVDRLSCPAWLVVSLSGAAPGSSLGRLSVTYDVEFSSAQVPERPLSLHSAVSNVNLGFELPSTAPAEPFFAISWTTVIPLGNVAGWIVNEAHEYMNDSFSVRAAVNEVNVSAFFVGTATAHPNSRAWRGTASMVDHSCLVNITGGVGRPQPRAHDYYCGCTDLTAAPGNTSFISVFADLYRPANTTGDWTFRFEFYPVSSNTYTGGGNQNTFSTAHLEVAEALN